jgi:hypothetical protein
MSVAGHDGAVAHTGGDGAGNSALKNRKKQEKKIENHGRFLEFWGLQVEIKGFWEWPWRTFGVRIPVGVCQPCLLST